jgi:hypothetical protein
MMTRLAIAAVLVSVAVGCGDDSASRDSTNTTDGSLLAKCGDRGAPVTLAKLVSVLRSQGISLDVDREGCNAPESDPHHPHATNAGPSGLSLEPGVARREGHVLCHVVRAPNAKNREVEVVKYPTDEETQVGVLNVGCAIYPTNAASEARQVNRLRDALEALSGATRT